MFFKRYILQESKQRFRCLLSLSKVRLIGNLVNQVVRFQSHAFNLAKVDAVADFLAGKCVDDLGLLRVSLTLETDEAKEKKKKQNKRNKQKGTKKKGMKKKKNIRVKVK
jgi:hypothetical protein